MKAYEEFIANREELGLTQEELAEEFNVSIAPEGTLFWIKKIEAGGVDESYLRAFDTSMKGHGFYLARPGC